MLQRVISGVILALLVIAILFFDIFWLRMAIVLILMLVAQHEMRNALRTMGKNPMSWPGYVYCLAVVPLFILGLANGVWIVMVLVVLAVFTVNVFQVERGKREGIEDAFSSLSPILYPLLPFQFLMAAVALPGPHWRTVLLLGVGVACITDTFALFGGMAFGKHKLAPTISPKKTWEGAISGFIAGILGGLLFYALQWLWGGEMQLWVYIVTAALASVAGQMGDLTASSIKRACGVKDFGNLIPGHGGVLDRLDSIVFAVAVSYIIVSLVYGVI